MEQYEDEVWTGHPKQMEALSRSEFEVLFGGARGGGKTDAGLVWLTDYIDNPRYRALVIRKNADDLSDWVDRANRFYRPFGANLAYRPAEVTFPSGAIIHTGHLKDDQAYTKYQGQEYQRMLVEELTQIPDVKRYLQLLASCRSTIPEIKSQVFATTNPGGLGHVWVKERFVDPSPPGVPFKDPTTGRSRIYIPATVDDNPTLVTNDPDYVAYLEGLKDTDVELWKAWRLGDWTTFAGQFFREWRTNLHTCKSFIPPKGGLIVGGMDWGRNSKPAHETAFAFYLDLIEKIYFNEIPFYRCRTFFEVAGKNKGPRDWSEEIRKKLSFFNLTLLDVAWVRADNQIFSPALDNSKSIADQFVDDDPRWRGLLRPASKDRVGGWENLHNWLSIAPDKLPYWQIAENCVHLIRTLPSLVHDENKVNDVDTESEDHPGDSQRYEKKHLKWLDARLGGIITDKQAPRAKPVIQLDDEGKQIPVNLEAWEKAPKSTNTRVISGTV